MIKIEKNLENSVSLQKIQQQKAIGLLISLNVIIGISLHLLLENLGFYNMLLQYFRMFQGYTSIFTSLLFLGGILLIPSGIKIMRKANRHENLLIPYILENKEIDPGVGRFLASIIDLTILIFMLSIPFGVAFWSLINFFCIYKLGYSIGYRIMKLEIMQTGDTSFIRSSYTQRFIFSIVYGLGFFVFQIFNFISIAISEKHQGVDNIFSGTYTIKNNTKSS